MARAVLFGKLCDIEAIVKADRGRGLTRTEVSLAIRLAVDAGRADVVAWIHSECHATLDEMTKYDCVLYEGLGLFCNSSVK
jgi:hypothetical protein